MSFVYFHANIVKSISIILTSVFFICYSFVTLQAFIKRKNEQIL